MKSKISGYFPGWQEFSLETGSIQAASSATHKFHSSGIAFRGAEMTIDGVH